MAAIDDLKHLLAQDVRQLSAMADLLRDEKELLSTSDIKQLQALTDEKNAQLEQIRERAKLKIHALVAMGFRPESGNPSRFIAAAGLTELHQLWRQADQALTQCQQLNQNNGRVMAHMQKRLARLSDIVRGASSRQKLYGAGGQHTAVSSSIILASA
jgi:flagella synthesis protein FlgN